MIINKTTGKILAKETSTYRGMMLAKGLTFSRKRVAFFEFSIPQTSSIHTLFVFYPIDVLFLDAKKKVVEKYENMRPFSFYTPKHEAKYMIELPSNLGRSVSIGNIITFK